MKTLRPIASLALLSLVACDAGSGDDGGMHMGGGMCSAADGKAKDNGDSSLNVAWQSDPTMIMTSEAFALDVTITANSGALPEDLDIDVDARMPAHGHGMNTSPQVTAGDPGVFTVDGMNFHMAGAWELYIDLLFGGNTERVTFNVDCEG